MLTKKQITHFQKTVYAYYQKNKRALPWRKNINPYRVIVSEMMLQQTQVDRVIPKFQNFISQFPNFKSLAIAPLSLVLKMWSGLGYNRRAIALHQLAKIVDGLPPHLTSPQAGEGTKRPLRLWSVDDWDALPGIGPATAAAICVYAFNRPYPFIETNVRAVFIHHFFSTSVEAIHELPLRKVDDKDIFPLVEKTLDIKNPREWFWALMDYGVYLKKIHRNPARRSAHHVKQSKFEGSNRQLRGRILKMLLTRGRGAPSPLKSPSGSGTHDEPTVNDLAKLLCLPKQKVAPVVAQLVKDGFIKRVKNRLTISS